MKQWTIGLGGERGSGISVLMVQHDDDDDDDVHKPDSLHEDETENILWDFRIKTDHLIPAWRLDQYRLTNDSEFVF